MSSIVFLLFNTVSTSVAGLEAIMAKPFRKPLLVDALRARSFSFRNMIKPISSIRSLAMAGAVRRAHTTAGFDFQSDSFCRFEDSPFYIHKACGQGQVDVVERLLDEDETRLTTHDNKGWTCLHHAANRGRLKIMDLLIDRGIDVNVQDKEGNTPLHIACEKGKLDSVSHLLIQGAEGNILNGKSHGPIHIATLNNRPSVIQELAKFGEQVDLNLKGYQGGTALHCASVCDFSECAEKLIENNCKLCQPDDNGFYPIHVAAKNASVNTLEVLLKSGEKNGYTREVLLSFADKESNAPLHSAVNSGDIEVVKICLEHGAQIDTKQEDQATAFHLACSQGTPLIVQLMFETHIKKYPSRGAEILFNKDVVDMTPLHRAAMFNHPEVVKYLIDMGSELDSLDNERRTPLLLAAVRGGVQSLDILLHSGASVTIKDSSKRNVLHFLVTFGGNLSDELDKICAKEEGRKLLNQKDVTGCTPLHLASKQGNLRFLESLLNLGAMVNLKDNEEQSPLHFAARYGRINTVRRLLRSEQGPNIINECDGSGMTAMHLASMNGHAKVVQQLLYKGALLHKDFIGRSPLHLATESGYTQTMRLLLSFHGNLLDQKDRNGNTALHYASSANKATSVELLLTAGAVYDSNDDRKTPLDICIENKHVESATVFVEHDRMSEVLHRCSSLYGTPLLGLVQYLPGVYKVVLDRCRTVANCDPTSKDYWEKYTFEYMQIDVAKFKDIKKRHSNAVPLLVPNHMVKYGRVDLLSHPVSLQFLRLKWKAYGFWFYSINLFLYSIFLACLTCAVVSLDPTIHSCWINNFTDNTTNTKRQATLEEEDKGSLVSFRDLRCFIMLVLLISVLVNMVKEFFQMYQQRKAYFADFVNYTEWMMYLSTLLFVGPLFVTPGHCLSPLQWQCGAIAVFLAWFNLLMYLARTQSMGIYIVMFLQILSTVLRVMLVFSVLFIAFGLTFRILLINDPRQGFYNSFIAIIRTLVMMMGDWDFVSLYVNPYTTNKLLFPYLNFLFLILFIILMPILFINLLIGLAVGDIEMVLRDAQLKRLAMQVNYHTELEERMPRWLLKRVDKNEAVIYPNTCTLDDITIPSFLSRLLKWIKQSLEIQEKSSVGMTPSIQQVWDVVPRDDHTNQLLLCEWLKAKTNNGNRHRQANQLMLKNKNPTIHYICMYLRMKDIKNQLDKQHELIRLIVQKMEISSEADQYDEGVQCQAFGLDSKGSLAANADASNRRPLGSRIRARINPVLAFKKGAKKQTDDM